MLLLLTFAANAQNTWQTALSLEHAEWSSVGTLSGGVEEYFYRMELQGESYLDIEMEVLAVKGSQSSYIDIYGYRLQNNSLVQISSMYGSSGTRIFGNQVGDTLKWRYTQCADGVYYFKIRKSYTDSTAFRCRYFWDGGAAYPNDPEPNNDYKHATTFQPGETVYGHIGFQNHTTGVTDNADYYKFTVEKDCDVYMQFNMTPCPGTKDGDFRLEMGSWQIMSADSTWRISPIGTWRANSNYGGYDTVKTMRYKGLSAGTYYFQVYPVIGYGYYNFKMDVEYYDVPIDPEPNDEYRHATEIKPGETIYGHAGFYDQTQMKKDGYDCYKFTVEKDCHLRMQFNIQPKGEGDCRFDVGSIQYMKSDSTFAWFQTLWGEEQGVYDTLKRYYSMGLAKGTYYFQVYPYVGLCTYNFKLDFEYPPFEGDLEPNDTWAQAIPLQEGDTAWGHLAFRGASDSTGIYTDMEDWYRVNLPGNGSFNIYAASYPLGSTGYSSDDKLSFSFSLHQVSDGVLTNIGGLSGESIQDTLSHQYRTHLAKGTYYLQVKNTYGYGMYKFVYETRPAPVADFDFIQRINDEGQTEVCFFNKTKGETTQYEWSYLYYNWTMRHSDVNPTITFAEPGVYDVSLIAYGKEGNDTITKMVEIVGLQRVETPKAGQGEVTLKFYAGGMLQGDMFILEKDSVEYEGVVLRELKPGCMEVRFDLAHAELGYYNAIIRHADHSEMTLSRALELEPVIEPEIYVDLLGLDKMLFNRWQNFTAVMGNKGNIDAYNQTLWLVTPDDENCRIQLRNTSFIAPEGDTLSWIQEIPPYLIYDSLKTGGRPVRVYPLMFSFIPAGSEVTVNFRMSSNKSEEISVFATNPFVTESLLKEYESYESCVAWSIAKYTAEKAVGFVLDQIPGAGCVKDVVKFTYQTTESTCQGNIQVGSLAWSIATTAWSCAKEFVGPLKAYKMTCDIVDLMIDIADNYSADQECRKYKKKEEKAKKVEAVASMDPNEISGPSGFGEYNDVRKQDFTYNILFENKATATAPAQEVNITDTLDKTKFDLNSIKFKSFGISDSIYTIQQSGLAFVTELDWDSVIVRVSGQLDTLTGVVSWQFITLDPTNRELITNPDAGFLKPNITAPEGEGFVCYTISLSDKVKDGDVISNQATIIFDLNEPIMTNVYSNRIDENKPSSSISRIEKEEGTDDVYTLYFSGNDKGSGIYFYRLSMSVNGQDATVLSNHIASDRYSVILSEDSVYRFYLQAVDSLYIEETPKSTPDYVYTPTGIPGYDEDPNHVLMMLLRPNPTQRVAHIDYRNSQSGEVSVEIFNMMGVRVHAEELGYTAAGIHTHAINVSRMAKGIYAVRLRCGNEIRQSKLMVQ